MTSPPIAYRIPGPTASPPRSPSAGRLDCASGTVHRALAEAPIGGYGMLEAALAWQHLRSAGPGNTGGGTHATASRHLPVVETRSGAVAARIARLLSGLAWAIVTQADAGDTGFKRSPVMRVEVPRTLHRRVLRALTNAWRDARRQFDPSVPGTATDADAAVALWRMGILVAGLGPSHNMVYLRTGTSTMAEMMAAAARCLGLTPIVDNVQGAPAVALYHRSEVHWLLAEAGAGGAATMWVRGGRPAGAAGTGVGLWPSTTPS
ncbi:hypothetical protein [Streptosporangium sp. NPDC001681]|uniref:hypothetical protein n=1 Tax=Streptosporangium sp. NPDC001681 TaxID=3154395 RepID=UPI003329A5A2